MKTNKWIILLLLVFFQCTHTEEEWESYISRGACFPEVKDKYIYPVVPGMIEWQQLSSTDDAYKLCQLPNEVLNSISTPGLIDALIHAPLFTEFYFLSSDASAIKWHRHYEQFNSAKKLFKRKDAGNALVAYYKLFCFDCVNSPLGLDEGREKLVEYHRLIGLECLFTKKEILDKMGHQKKKDAIAALLENYEKFPTNVNSIFPMIYLMYADEYKPVMKYSRDNSERFQMMLDGLFYSSDIDEQVDLIISFAKSFIND